MDVVGMVGVREEGAEEGDGEVEADDWLWRPLKGNGKRRRSKGSEGSRRSPRCQVSSAATPPPKLAICLGTGTGQHMRPVKLFNLGRQS